MKETFVEDQVSGRYWYRTKCEGDISRGPSVRDTLVEDQVSRRHS
jgi:hypothetical protein